MANDQDDGARARAIAAMFSTNLLDAPPADDDTKRTRLLPRGGTGVRTEAKTPDETLGTSDDTIDATPREDHLRALREDPLMGATLGGLRVHALIGSGGVADVYLARDGSGHDVALKVLRDEWARSPEARRRLAREAAVLEVIDHPNIVRVLGSGETPDGRPYIVMERIVGASLRTVLTEGALTADRARAITLEIAEGLAVAHDAGVLHRDLKPANVMLALSGVGPGAQERVKLVDFGCARATKVTPDERHLTSAFGFLGTPAFAAPEQLASPSTVDARADLYALGGLVYAMITGEPPFGGSLVEVLAKKQQLARPATPPEAGGLGALAIALLAPRPDDRPRTARDVIRQLELLDGAASRTELLELDGLGEVLDVKTTALPAPAEPLTPLGHVAPRVALPEADAVATAVAPVAALRKGPGAMSSRWWWIGALAVAALAVAALLTRR